MAPPSKNCNNKHSSTFLLLEMSLPDSTDLATASNSTDLPNSLSEGESFECFGANDLSENNNGVELELSAPRNSSLISENEGNNISRNTWARTSLRLTPKSSGKIKKIGSNALANHLHRSSSFNSSGRSSNCDTTEDMYSDVSLEDVQDLNHKLETLQRQVTNLADTQSIVDDRTTKARTEYAVLKAKYIMLEEQFRETELRSEERVTEEKKRYRDLLARVERESELQNENCQIKMKTIELEMSSLKDELKQKKMQFDKQEEKLAELAEKLEMAKENSQLAQEELAAARTNERKHNIDKQAAEYLMIELGNECERLRTERGPALPTTSSETIRLEELHQEMEELRHTKKILEESNEELQALMLNRGIEEGRNLLNGTSNSLAQELEAMSQNQLQMHYQEKEDENLRLRIYIDTILLNIVENYPQLLEVKPSCK